MFLIQKLVKKFNFNLKVSILFFSLLFLNPYIIRYHIFNPTQAHDMLFFCLGLAFSLTIIYKKFLINILTTISSIYLRQSSIALLIGSSIFLLVNRKIKLILILLIFYFLSFFIIIKTGNYISVHSFSN